MIGTLHIRKLYMTVNINGVARNLVITMDNSWLDEVELKI